MATDQTPRQPQVLDDGGSSGPSQPQDDPGQGASPEQVFAGESGDPIWESRPARRGAGATADDTAGAHRVPRSVNEEKLPGRLIDLVHAPPPGPAPGTTAGP